jgi:HK97 family phage portal protein
MRLFSPSTWGAKKIEKKAAGKVIGLSEELGSFLKFGSSGNAASPASAINLYNKSTAVSIPINYIADAFSSLSPVIINGDEIIKDHPIIDLLNDPSPFFSQNLFFEALAKYYLITGEVFLVGVGNINRPPVELQPVSPADVSSNETSGFVQSYMLSELFPGQYQMERRGRAVRYLRGPLAEIKQIRGFASADSSMLRGQSLLVSASSEAMQHIKGNTHNVSLLSNGGRMSLVFHFDSDMDEDDFEATRQRVQEQYGGETKAGAIGVTSGGKLAINELGVSNKDMDFANLQMAAQRAVALQYKVPLPLITTDASSFNNYKEAKTALYDDAVLPLADRIFGGLTDFLMPRYGLDPARVKITYDQDKITALTMRRNEEIKLRRDLNIESTNELRALLGREEVEGGDQILAPATMIPIGTDIFTDDNLKGGLDD